MSLFKSVMDVYPCTDESLGQGPGAAMVTDDDVARMMHNTCREFAMEITHVDNDDDDDDDTGTEARILRGLVMIVATGQVFQQ
jgi:hypothetical protein